MGKSFQYKGIKVRYKASSDVYLAQISENNKLCTKTDTHMREVIDYQLAMSKPRYSSELEQKLSKLSSELYMNFFDSMSVGHSIKRTDDIEHVTFSWLLYLNAARSTNIDEHVHEWLSDKNIASECSYKRCGRGLRLFIKIQLTEIK